MKKSSFRELFFSVLIMTVSLFFTPAWSMAGEDAYYRITKKGVLIIGVSKNYPPLNFNAGEKGADIKLAEELARFLKVKPLYVPLDVSEYTAAIENGSVDVVIAGFARTLSRSGRIWFSVPYLTVTPGVFVRSSIFPPEGSVQDSGRVPVRTLWDLRDFSRISFIIKSGSSGLEILQEFFPSSPVLQVESNEQGLAVLEKGDADAFLHDSLYLEYVYNSNPSLRKKFRFLSGGNFYENICVGMPFDSTVLKNQIDVFIEELKRQGKIDAWIREFSGR